MYRIGQYILNRITKEMRALHAYFEAAILKYEHISRCAPLCSLVIYNKLNSSQFWII